MNPIHPYRISVLDWQQWLAEHHPYMCNTPTEVGLSVVLDWLTEIGWASAADVARLEGERDEAQRTAEQWLEVAHSHEMKLAARTAVVEAAVAWRAGLETVGAARRHIALIAAIDQTAARTAWSARHE